MKNMPRQLNWWQTWWTKTKRRTNPKRRKREKTTLSPSYNSRWKKYWQFPKEEEDKDSEVEADEAEDKGPLAPIGATDADNLVTSVSNARQLTRPLSEAEEEAEVDADIAQCRT